MHIPIIAFDFSCNKPAACCLIDNNITYFTWPLNMDDKTKDKLSMVNVIIKDRNLSSMSDSEFNEHSLIYEHVKRAKALAELIVDDIKNILMEKGYTDFSNVVIANEGFSFASNGDAALDLAGYKYILMDKLVENGFTNLKTYAPITIKSTAGCAKRGMGKAEMIAAAGENTQKHLFNKILCENPQALKKKTAFVSCVDDLADAYWCMKTVIKKEKIDCELNEW